jgi:hypothetical protein
MNEEQILELCIIAVNDYPEMMEGYAGEFLTYYALTQLGMEATNEELSLYITDLCTSYTLGLLVNKGLIECNFDEDGNPEYSPS